MRPEIRAGDDLVPILERWETSGGHLRVLSATDGSVTIGMFACDGHEEMDRVTGTPSAALEEYLISRPTD